jgi:Thioesterase-like superfamily
MEWRALEGGFLESGPAKIWLRQRVPLVEGEEPTPLQRTLVIADVGNGISAVLDWSRYIFINVDLTVALERMPEGEWVLVDAVTRPREGGIGTAESELSDRRGRVGRAIQTLLFADR